MRIAEVPSIATPFFSAKAANGTARKKKRTNQARNAPCKYFLVWVKVFMTKELDLSLLLTEESEYILPIPAVSQSNMTFFLYFHTDFNYRIPR